ncbi:MAG: hypothetical protein M1833_003268 [Piccolia ochrophora]|nr:MAG: hypothetical protein M1833_003268 [Piccolia ochrophora]
MIHNQMIEKMLRPSSTCRTLPSFLVPFTYLTRTPNRSLHQQRAPSIPSPTPFVPDAPTFLKLIGRNLIQHAAKFPTWEALFSLTTQQLRELGLEPARDRRYLLRWRDKFRKGEFGVGGDLEKVADGMGIIKVVELPMSKGSGQRTMGTVTSSAGKRKVIVNVLPDEADPDVTADDVRPVRHLKISGAHTIKGPFVTPIKGSQGKMGRIKVQDGMWEEKRGRKIDGGERRRAEVRAKRAREDKK